MARAAREGGGVRWRLWLGVAGWCVAGVSTAMAARQVHRYMLHEPQFVLVRYQRDALVLEGVRYASPPRILRVFAADFDRSIFAIPLAERRRRLLAVDWVEDASVSRIWPNRLVVRITERKPVAFAAVRSGSASRVMLVDAHGVLLDPPPQARFSFPVLSGIGDEQDEAERRVRVRAMMQLLEDLGPLAAEVSEVNAGNIEDLKVIAQVEGRAVELELGDGNFRKRFQNFLNHYPEIRKRTGEVAAFDLRLDDRITAKEEP
jgi:cell division protein FtsQ